MAQARSLAVWHCSRCLQNASGNSTKRQVRPVHEDARQGAETAHAGTEAVSPQANDIPARLAQLRQSISIVRLIPKPARILVADSLSKRINDAICSTDPVVWWKLFSFAYSALKSPDPKSDRKCTLATHIKRQVCEANEPEPDERPEHQRRDTEPSSCENIARRVQARCADGDIGAALRVLTSSESLAQPTEDVQGVP